MAEALLFVSIGSFVAVSATLVVAALTLRDARRSVELAEDCIEYLREEQARLLVFLREERRTPEEKQEREQYLEDQQRAERLSRRRLPRREQRRLTRELEQERRARRDAERRIDRLKRELRDVRQESSPPPVPAGVLEDLMETRGSLGEKPLPSQRAREAGRTPRRPAGFPETAASEPAEASPKDTRPRLGVWHPHPDDADQAPAEQARAQSDAPVKMFRKHYDKYLENYQGYVELAEKLYRMRDNGQRPSDSLGEREWEEKLRRVNDGIERTTARLDILEEHNPALATDDERISRRTSIARRHSELERNGRERRSS